MKKKLYNSEEEVRKTLSSLDRLQQVNAPSDLYQRVMDEVRQSPPKVIPLYRQWQVAAAVLLLLVNSLGVGLYISQTNQAGEQNYYEALAEDYGQSLIQETIGY